MYHLQSQVCEEFIGVKNLAQSILLDNELNWILCVWSIATKTSIVLLVFLPSILQLGFDTRSHFSMR